MFGVACPSVELFSLLRFFPDIQSESPRPKLVIISCVISSARIKKSLTGDRPVGYLCTTAMKKISSFSACETEQKIITVSTAYSRSHLVS